MMNAYYGPAYSPFDKQGIGVFTARPGMGKSYASRCFASNLNTGSLNDIKMLMNYGCDYDSVR